MIYSFLSDEAFAVTSAQSSVMPVKDIQKYKLGILDDNLLNYFDDHTVINDPVGSTRAINRTTRQSVDESTGGAVAVRAVGRMFFNLDASKLGLAESTERAFISSITVDVGNDNDTVINEKVVRRAALFNIVEAVFFARTDTAHIKSLSAIEAILTGATGSTFAGYVPESLKLSTTITERAVYRYTKVPDTTILSSDNLDFYNWCEFKFKYGENDTDIVEIKVWLSTDEFKSNYPFSTITDVVYPCKPEWILDPVLYGSEVKAVLQSSNYKDSVLDDAITARDHSGISVYKTRYVHANVSSDAQMGFVVMYKGAAPSSAAMRAAIKEKLLAETNSITGSLLADESEWKKVLPDLFVDSGFYIFPCYYQRASFGDNVIEQNISNYKTMYSRLRNIFTGDEFTDQQLFDYAEIIQAPGHGMYMITMPVGIDDSNLYKSILAIHPTYQPLDSVGSVTEFKPTNDSVFLDKQYYYQNPLAEHEFIPITFGVTRINDVVYNLNDGVPTSPVIYERIYVIEKDDWNTMTSATKAFAWSLARCVAACIDKTISLSDNEFTREELGSGSKREYYSFVSNSTEYHVLTLAGAEGVFDGNVIVTTGEEHVSGYIH
ncbi:MAG: hypothetical protein IKA36_06930 [Clostridia bacterium]|nr:hypothetical protein [Clostridia bacterium]